MNIASRHLAEVDHVDHVDHRVLKNKLPCNACFTDALLMLY